MDIQAAHGLSVSRALTFERIWERARSREGRRPAAVPALFAALFAAQAGVISLSPVLGEVASDFGVSTAEAGQLRTASGLAAGLTALVLMRVTQRRSLREFLRLGALLLAAGSVGTIVAPSFAVVALAQVVVGIGVGLLVSAATEGGSCPGR